MPARSCGGRAGGGPVGFLVRVRGKAEVRRGVRISGPAIVAAAELSARYITDRFLPDKAIDLIDEAGCRMRIRRMTAPPDLREFEEKIATVRLDNESALVAPELQKASS